jgi:catechol 2,3-dioxygenase-like lactoylglutathione lyase family enzyme
MLKKINTVTLHASHQQKTRDFYVDYPGSRVRRDEYMGPMGSWLVVAPDGAQAGFMLASIAGFGKQDQIGASADIVLHAGDIPALHQRLIDVGVLVPEPEVKERGTFIKITDPDRLEMEDEPASVRPASRRRYG